MLYVKVMPPFPDVVVGVAVVVVALITRKIVYFLVKMALL